jgi:hypothetical protein
MIILIILLNINKFIFRYRPEPVVENDIKKYSKKKRLRQFRKKLELLEEQNPPEYNSWSIKSIRRKINEEGKNKKVNDNNNKKKKQKRKKNE